MGAISGISFRGGETAGSVSYLSANQNIRRQNNVNFRQAEYPYYNEEPKNKHTGLKVIAGTTIAAAAAIVGMGFTHKYSGNVTNETLKKILNWAEPATKKCHEWCALAKNKGEQGLEAVKSWFN